MLNWLFGDRPTASEAKRAYEELNAFRKVGETFQYLGKTFVVRRHCDPDGIPKLVCQYFTDGGVLMDEEFYISDLPALRRHNDYV